ncbi:cation-transporting P-type ATPase [Polyangium sp. y55x31]|uniref:cation-translocating P-type ATPase n=1 Tax=Polyangium sp. y55x31 TaxID=3042688 RepID=UPI002482BB9A|nr:cation-transporting P-type ATPase [Polyangium sp. y55x31]MDI1477868.1 cation-transporting P-type ATPase [Polyangium sp. y55x31]
MGHAGKPSGRVVHSEQRLRVEVAGLFGEPLRARRIERALGALPGVVEARANEHTGTVLCVLAPDAETTRADVLAILAEHEDSQGPPPPSLSRIAENAAASVHDLLRTYKTNGRDENEEDTTPATPWHARSIDELTQAFSVDLRTGLSAAEAHRILREVGPNVLAGVAPRTSLEILAGQVFTVPTALLAGAAGLSVLLGDLLEAGAILLVVGSNVVVGYFTESRAEELLDAWSKFRVEWARVLRDGVETTVAASEVVPGDVLCVRAGDAIAADARIVQASDLSVDESTLTGESEPAEKATAAVAEGAPLADRDDMLYTGTVVATGSARAIVVATGRATELGAIQRALSHTADRAAPLEQQLDQLGRRVATLAFGSSIAVTALGLLRGQPLAALARSAVALGVAAIPEGFPAVGTTALALASQRLNRKGIVIRRLAAAETLGAVSVVCADKTGTLTENRMRVAEVFLPGEGLVRVEYGATSVENGAPPSLGLIGEDGRCVPVSSLREIGRIAALNADVELDERDEITSGSGTERALVEFAMAIGYPVRRRRGAAKRVREERRSAERPFMVTVHEHPDLGRIELVKGAPEPVIERASVDPEGRARLLAMNDAMASRGLRVLALAWRKDGDETKSHEAPLVLAGLVGMRDPPRRGVREALAVLAGAGVRTMMLTGDQARTAQAIGAELGIGAADVYSRVTPEAKLDVVRELQDGGAIVAMTGDGVNDGPALKAADVGVAMGERGTDIARAVADVVLAHDDLGSLADAVSEGRRLYDNVRRAIEYLVATNASEVMVMLAGSVVGAEPLGPLQLLWINMLTDVAPALALAIEPADADVMRRPPRDPQAPLFGQERGKKLAREASKMAAVSLAAYGIGALGPGANVSRARTMSFASLVVAQLLHARSCRSSGSLPNPELERALVVSLGLQAAALGLPGLRRVLGTTPLGPIDLSIAVVLGLLPTLAREGKALFNPEAPIVVERRGMPAGSTQIQGADRYAPGSWASPPVMFEEEARR